MTPDGLWIAESESRESSGVHKTLMLENVLMKIVSNECLTDSAAESSHLNVVMCRLGSNYLRARRFEVEHRSETLTTRDPAQVSTASDVSKLTAVI